MQLWNCRSFILDLQDWSELLKFCAMRVGMLKAHEQHGAEPWLLSSASPCAVSSCHTHFVADLPLQRVYRKKQRSTKQCIIALHQLFSCSSPTCRQGSSGKYFDLLLNRAAPTPKTAPRLPSSQTSISRSSAGPSSSSGAFPISWNHLLGTTSLLLMKSPCALLSLGNNHVLQRKQKKIKNKSPILMINSGDRGNNHSKWRLFWGREGFLSKAGCFLPGHCR